MPGGAAAKSPFDTWQRDLAYQRPGAEILREEREAGKLFFPPELVPVLDHPEVAALGSQAREFLCLQRLYTYDRFTVMLERQAINPAVLRICDDDLDIAVPERTRRDADLIYADEAMHAVTCNRVLDCVAEVTGIRQCHDAPPEFLAKLRARKGETPSRYHDLLDVGFCVVSETLISGILGKIPHDQRLVSAVRTQIREHAEDEGRHFRFFSDFFETVFWPQLTPDQRRFLGPCLADFIDWFLRPDRRAAQSGLEQLALRADTIEAVLEDSYREETIRAEMRAAARHTLQLFERTGVFADPGASDAFCRRGLVGDA